MLRARSTLLITVAGIGAVLGSARPAAAQIDINPPLPNVMLLVDSSGSMELKSSSAVFPSCDPTGSQTSEKSRWIELVEVLTGSISNYRCQELDRSSAAFRNEYSLDGTAPPDWQYVNKYHRPLSGTCTPGPGVLPTNAYDFAGLKYHAWDDPNATCTSFQQSSNGLLDSFSARMRFGLMTFDSHPHVGTGVSGTSASHPDGVLGTWSYFINGVARQGKPAACPTLQDQEVGARNAAAPPWEGRMVAFGDPNATNAAVLAKNEQIQQILLAVRPYGATPIAGMLHDARDFLWNDNTKDPLDLSKDFGPYNDPQVVAGCRPNFLILLSDGEPNLDLRPFCEGAGPPAGVCPYQKPELVAEDLANASDVNRRVKTAVVGFAVSQVTLPGGQQVDCKNMSDDDLTGPTGLCAQHPNERQLQACCTLSRIAFSGGTTRARFANDMQGLRDALSAILTEFNPGTTSRTLPVFASASNLNSTFAGSFRFFSSFRALPTEPPGVWSGVLERQRFVCQNDNGVQTPVELPIDESKGDSFAANVNSGLGSPRDFHSVEGDDVGGAIFSERTIRPFIGGNSDGLGIYSGTQYRGEAAQFVAATDPAAMAIVSNATCPGLNADDCRDLHTEWLVGITNDAGQGRCVSPSQCSLIGDIYHSTPVVVGPPSALLRDETYVAFASDRASRPLVVYTSTNDGFLHAFKVAKVNDADTVKVESRENNELWAFMPPAVLPDVKTEYPATHQQLLDGMPVVRDITATGIGGNQFRFERDSAQARVATAGTGTWRTVLVQSFGTTRPGYFAVDITDPVRTSDPATGPKFLWQLTTDGAGNGLFGDGGATPLITTLFFADDSEPVKEISVAVLPGGIDGLPTTGASCPRAETSFDNVDSTFPPRTAVKCYQPGALPGRSLTVVRLDNGKVIRTFRRSVADTPAGLDPARVIATNLDSPITGQPVAFPGQTGAISDRLFVADAEGTLWRVNVASPNPSEWQMTLFFDAYPASGASVVNTFSDGQPVTTPPVLSVDELGRVTVALSTGDQELLTPSGRNYVWSLLEMPDTTDNRFVSKANWFETLIDGERVTGPMSLFNGALFFSSFKPGAAAGGACGDHSSKLWGIDYLAPEDPGDLSDGGKARLNPTPGNVSVPPVRFIDPSSTGSVLGGDFIIFGVSVVQVPTCFDEPQTEVDPYFGSGGSFSRISNINPGNFQLLMHTGPGGNAVQGGQTNVLAFNLPTPASVAHIDSWAAIVE